MLAITPGVSKRTTLCNVSLTLERQERLVAGESRRIVEASLHLVVL